MSPVCKKILAVLDLVGSKVCFEADLVKLTEGSITKKGERSNIQGKIISDLYFFVLDHPRCRSGLFRVIFPVL